MIAKRSFMAVLVLFFFAASFAAFGGGDKEKAVSMKLGWAETADPAGHPVSAGMYAFKNYVEKNASGKITVNLYPAGQLGDAKSMIKQVKEGMIESCASIPSGMIAGSYYKNVNIFEVPYLFANDQIAWKIINPTTAFFKDLSEDMAGKTGIRPFAFLLEGQRHFTNNKREIKSPTDLKGLKIRTMEVPAHMKMVEAMGAMPTPVSWLELYSALQTGVVDGQENPIFNIEYLKGYEVQKYLTLDGHITLLNVWCVNEKWFKGLSQEVKSIILDGVKVAADTHREKASTMNAEGVKRLEAKGMKVYSPSPAELQQFRDVTQQVVIPYIKNNVDDSKWISRLEEEINKAK